MEKWGCTKQDFHWLHTGVAIQPNRTAPWRVFGTETMEFWQKKNRTERVLHRVMASKSRV